MTIGVTGGSTNFYLNESGTNDPILKDSVQNRHKLLYVKLY